MGREDEESVKESVKESDNESDNESETRDTGILDAEDGTNVTASREVERETREEVKEEEVDMKEREYKKLEKKIEKKIEKRYIRKTTCWERTCVANCQCFRHRKSKSSVNIEIKNIG